MPGFHAVGWFGVFAAAKTPQATVNRLNSEISGIMQDADMRKRLIAQGVEPLADTPDDLRRYLAREIEAWGKVTPEAGIKVE